MKPISWSPSFQKKLKEIKRRDPRLFKLIEKRFKQFEIDPHYPALRIHKLEGNLENVFSLSVTMSIRILFIEDDEYFFFDIGTHDQTYRK